MRNEILEFIRTNNLSIFNKSIPRISSKTIFKTRDARDVHQRVLNKICSNFVFDNTKSILKILENTPNQKQIESRQSFFKSLDEIGNVGNKDFTKLKKGFPSWRPDYDVIVATDDEADLIKLKSIGCPTVFINNPRDLMDLDKYDLVQVLRCEDFRSLLERIPQTFFLDSVDDVYLERFLIELSSWKKNLEFLMDIDSTPELKNLVRSLNDLLPLIDKNKPSTLSEQDIESELESINEKIMSKIKEMTLTGESVVSLLVKGIPKEIKDILELELSQSKVPRELFTDTIPLRLDDKEVEDYLRRQSNLSFIDSAANIRKKRDIIKNIPRLLRDLEIELIYQDFISGIREFSKDKDSYPQFSEKLEIKHSQNLFLDSPQPISFYLDPNNRCSILTGANSGGKTTLLEHLIQIITLSQLGIPVSGDVTVPLFTSVYYFAKNKGSVSKGAFETLLTQMSDINPGEKTLILADEIESVTEPGVAGEIIVSTAEYFLDKDCFLVIATHLGQEIKGLLPARCRIDGIEAKGLTDNYDLIVDHNPILGKLANSTPELIIERMAKTSKNSYFEWLFKNLKNRTR